MTLEVANFLSVAWQAAVTAGSLIREQWQQPKSIDYKGTIDLVTSVDRESERRIVEVLQNNFPGHSILAEEETDLVGNQGNHRWIIDPLDGTTNFAHGYPQFCGSAALDLCYVACGRIDGFWELKLRPWDTAAGALIVEEAGGRLSDLSGNLFSIWGEETLASNAAVHEEMVSVASTASHASSLTEP